MKKKIIFLTVFACLFTACSADKTNKKECNCDYIKSGYYQLIYEADVAWLSGDRNTVFEKISEAKSLCPLIEQVIYYEISRYIDLLTERKQYDEAQSYIEELVRDYGYTIEHLEKANYFSELEKNIDWNGFKLHLSKLSEDFYSKVDTALVAQLIEMQRIDQKVRKNYYSKRWTTDSMVMMHKTDSINEQKIKYIFDNYGYPNDKLVGHANTHRLPPFFFNVVNIHTMLMHFDDTAYFRPKLLEFIRNGECSPDDLGSFIDSYQRRDTANLKFIYGIYDNSLDKIKDFPNLNNRRKAIGMPTLEMEQKRDSLIKIQYAPKIGELEVIVNGRGDTIEIKHF
ncbi:MAG: hypothetical protein LBC68_04005 [Prevotellaceae bacterium]|jgi:hypothetical protein|nr:hypothetical protein [Prevotellaceae bacterium]